MAEQAETTLVPRSEEEVREKRPRGFDEDVKIYKRREIEEDRQRELRGFKPKEFLAHANRRFVGAGEERRDCTS